MEDLAEMLDEQASETSASLDSALLGLDDDSEGEGDDESEQRIDDSLSGHIQSATLPSTMPGPIRAPATADEVIFRASPRQSPVLGHVYDIMPGRNAQRFAPALGPIEEIDSEKDFESSDDEGEAEAASHRRTMELAALPALPSVLGNDGLIQAGCESQCVDEALVPMEPGFGAELERVASRREMVAVVA